MDLNLTSTSTLPHDLKEDKIDNFLPLIIVVALICMITSVIYCYIISRAKAIKVKESRMFLYSRSLNSEGIPTISVITVNSNRQGARPDELNHNHHPIDNPPDYNTIKAQKSDDLPPAYAIPS